MKPTRGLGKGLSALFSETEEDYGKSLLFEEPENDTGQSVSEVDIGLVFANPNQPRKVFNETALKELADSISKHGVIMPIIVNKSGDRYMIIAGERRFRASKLAGLSKVPVIIKTYNERQIKEISLIENLQREDLNPVETAKGIKRLMDEYGLTQEKTYVWVRMGRHDREQLAYVDYVRWTTEENAPYPYEKAKRVLRQATAEEMEKAEKAWRDFY